MRIYKCKKCKIPMGYKKFREPAHWLSIAIPEVMLCDECYCMELEEQGRDTTLLWNAIYYNHGYDVLGKTPDEWGLPKKKVHPLYWKYMED